MLKFSLCLVSSTLLFAFSSVVFAEDPACPVVKKLYVGLDRNKLDGQIDSARTSVDNAKAAVNSACASLPGLNCEGVISALDSTHAALDKAHAEADKAHADITEKKNFHKCQ